MNEEKKIKFLDIFNAWGPAILAFLFPGGIGTIIGFKLGMPTQVVVISLVVFLALLVIYFNFLHSYVKAVLYQWHFGKFKGLWKDKALKSQIKKHFLKASKINIKVTRGTDLVDEETAGDISIVKELKTLKDKSSVRNPIQIKILLMAPCFKVKHVQKRYELHKAKYGSPQNFLKSWTKTFEQLVKYEDDYCKISVKFYYGGHSRWRFYICTDNEGDRKTVLLGNYDDETEGPDTPMYKIIKGEKNIGGFMDKYFDEIWNHSINLSELINSIKNDKCVRLFCEECKNSDNNRGCNTKCSAANCTLYSDCKARADEWKNFLDNLSKPQRDNFLG